MMLHRHDGQLHMVETWLGRCAVLDCTHPAAVEWLRTTVGAVVRDWGYTYLKLDALAFAAVSATDVAYSVSGSTAPQNLRRGLEIIRDAAGDETFILGCTCHFSPAVGLVDAMRVGPDVKELWFDGTAPSVRHAMRMTLQRNWMHGRWWANDPDCLVVRTDNTSLNDAETRFLATCITISGGSVVLSDDLAKVPPARKAMALALIPPSGVAARPIDPGECPVASTWRADMGEGRSLLAVLNWSDAPRWVVQGDILGPGDTAFDFWNGRLTGMGDILLQPHDALLLQVTASSRDARVVGDSGHVHYHGLIQREVSSRVQVRNESSEPRTIAVRNRRGAFQVDLAPGESRWFD